MTNTSLSLSCLTTVDTTTLHNLLGHVSNTKVFSPCDIYLLAKLPKSSFHISTYRASSLVHLDIWESYRTLSTHGCSYFRTILHDYSRYTWVCLLRIEVEVIPLIQRFCVMIETQYNSCVKAFRNDKLR